MKTPTAFKGTQKITKIMQKIQKMAYYLFIFRRYWAKEPRHSENIFAKKRYTSLYRSKRDPPPLLGINAFATGNPLEATVVTPAAVGGSRWGFFF